MAHLYPHIVSSHISLKKAQKSSQLYYQLIWWNFARLPCNFGAKPWFPLNKKKKKFLRIQSFSYFSSEYRVMKSAGSSNRFGLISPQARVARAPTRRRRSSRRRKFSFDSARENFLANEERKWEIAKTRGCLEVHAWAPFLRRVFSRTSGKAKKIISLRLRRENR